ncbi:MAG: SprT-like domain-containing protein [Lewinella sp.]|nr:SprT-like domain-containing protein [Lewinella sp.]
MTRPDLTPNLINPTKETYDLLQRYFDALNRKLFDEELPRALVTLQRKNRSYGFFASRRFARQDGQYSDEIALNPAHFRERSLPSILATLAHEMVHQWQCHYGKPSDRGYHNREWAAKMKEIGLQPTSTGEEGDKETGYKVHHLVIPGGVFEKAARRIEHGGHTIPWVELPLVRPPPKDKPSENEGPPQTRSGERLKYVCTQDGCAEHVRGRAGLKPLCQGYAPEGRDHAPAAMVPERSDNDEAA